MILMRSIQILFMYIWLDCEMKKMSLLELLDRIVRNSEKVPYITPDKGKRSSMSIGQFLIR